MDGRTKTNLEIGQMQIQRYRTLHFYIKMQGS